MIACPICGGRTAVTETRGIDTGIRRRRICADHCGGRLTTIEIVVSSTKGTSIGRVVVVSKRQLDKLRKIVAAIGGVP